MSLGPSHSPGAGVCREEHVERDLHTVDGNDAERRGDRVGEGAGAGGEERVCKLIWTQQHCGAATSDISHVALSCF